MVGTVCSVLAYSFMAGLAIGLIFVLCMGVGWLFLNIRTAYFWTPMPGDLVVAICDMQTEERVVRVLDDGRIVTIMKGFDFRADKSRFETVWDDRKHLIFTRRDKRWSTQA